MEKYIHYCWFGGKEKEAEILSYIDSWKKNFPTYKIVEWNEQLIDINLLGNKFVEEAYLDKNWAFVSDYVRLYALLNYGGIYLDTDVEVIKDFSSFTENNKFDCILGFEDPITVGTAIIIAKKKSKLIEEMFLRYSNKSYKIKGKVDKTANVSMITSICNDLGLELNGKEQLIKNDVKVYPTDYFYVKSYITNKFEFTENTHSVHHFRGSWTDKSGIKSIFKKILFLVLGSKLYYGLVMRLRRKNEEH